MSHRSLSLLGIITVAAVWLCQAPSADAYQVKRVLKGSFAIGTAEEVKTVDLGPAGLNILGGTDLVMEKTMMIANFSHNNNDFRMIPYIALDTPSQLLVARRDSGGGSTVNVDFFLVEFLSGVTVTHGLTTLADNTTTKNVTLPAGAAPDLTKAFAIYNGSRSLRNNAGSAIHSLFTVELTSTTNLRIQRANQTGAANNDVTYQVVSFDKDITVQKGSFAIGTGTGTLFTRDEPTDFAATVASKSMLFFSIRPAADGGEEFYAMDGFLDDVGADGDIDQIEFTRAAGSNNDVTIVWFLVEFKDAVFAQRNRATVTGNGTANNVTVTSTNTPRSFAVISAQSVAGSAAAGADERYVRSTLTTATNLQLIRETANGTGSVTAWDVAQLPPVTLTAPNGTEINASAIKVGTAFNITWQCADSAEGDVVKLEFSADGGTTWDQIPNVSTTHTCTSNAGSYSWTPAAGYTNNTNSITSNARIRVSSAVESDDGSCSGALECSYDISDASFHVKGTVAVTVPSASGITWKVGETSRTIDWTKTGTLSPVQIEMSEDGGGTWPVMIDSNVTLAEANCSGDDSCSYAWSAVTDNIGNDRKIKVSLIADATYVTDASDNNFTIKSDINLTQHDGGSPDWPTQTSQSINWTRTGTITSHDLQYSLNGGGAYQASFVNLTPAAANCDGVDTTCTYTWNVAVAAISDTARLKVTANQADSLTTSDESAADFKIVPSLKVTSPNLGTEVWRVGENTRAVTWNVNGAISFVKIEYSTNGFSDELQNGSVVPSTASDPAPVDGTGTYTWPSIPDAIGDNIKVRISDTAAPAPPAAGARYDISDQPFKIRGQISVTAPNGTHINNSALRVNSSTVPSTFDITWTRQGAFGNVDIHYNVTGCGSSYPVGNAIATNLAIPSPFTWTIPNDISPTACVRVQANSALYQTDTYGESPANFHIKGALDVTFPDGGETLGSGVNQTITWNKAGTFSNVSVEYTSDNTNYNVIIASTTADTDPPSGTNNGQYGPWAPTTVALNLYKVRVCQVGEANNCNTSGGTFSVKGALTNISPNATDYWMVGQQKNISWTSAPLDQGNVRIVYSLDGAAYPESAPDQKVTPTDVNSQTGTPYLWTVPAAAVGETVYFRIYRVLDPSGTKIESTTPIKIYNLVIDAPTTNEILRIGGTKLIQWTKTGAFSAPSANLKVIVSTNGVDFPDPDNVISTTIGSSFNWTNIPASYRSNTAKIRVQWQGEPTNVKKDVAVLIKPSVDMTAPDGGGPYGAGTNLNITWTHTGNASDNWKLRYSTNGGDAGGGTYPVGNVITTLTCAAPPCTHPWTMPGTLLSNNMRVKVELVGDETDVKDESVNTFEVKGSIISITPNTTQYWMVGQLKNITWNSNPDDQGNVRIVYSLDGTAYPESAPDQKVTPSDVASANETFPWTVPSAAIGETVYFRVYRVLDSLVKIDSTTPVKIYNLSVNNLPAILRVGANQTVQWVKTGSFTSPSNEFKVYLSTDGTTFPTELTGPPLPTGTTFGWNNIAAGARSETVKVRVVWQGETNIKAESNQVAVKPDVNLTDPDGGGPYGAGTTRAIAFTHTGTGSDTWKVLYSLNGGDAGGGTYPAGQAIATLTSSAATPLNGNTFTCTSLVSPVACTWTIPSSATVLSNTVRIKVELVGDEANVKDESLNAFAIKGSLTNIAPNTTQYWKVGEIKNISWTSGPADQGNVRIVYSLDGSAYPESTPDQKVTPVDVNSSTSPYAWTVPSAALGETVYFRIYRVLDPTVKIDSTTAIKIYDLAIGALPAILRVGDNQVVSWTKTGSFSAPSAEFKVLVSTDGTSFPNEVTFDPRPTGTSFNWNSIADALRSNTVKVKVQWQGSTNIEAISPLVAIKPKADLTSPNSGTYAIDDVVPVTFTHTGRATDTFRVAYSTDGGGSYPAGNVIATVTSGTVTPQNSHTFTCTSSASPVACSWTIPDIAGIVDTDIKVKAELIGDETDVKDESTSNVVFRGKLTVTAPTSTSTVWRVGDTTRAITWTSKGLTSVRIDYSKNNGGDGYAGTIVASTGAAAGTYTWNPAGPPVGIPLSATSDQFKIRVKAADAGDSATEHFSALFSVVPKLTLTYPTGGETLIVYALSSAAARTITWTRSGDSRNANDDFVEIYYTKDTTGDTDSDGIPDPPEVSWIAIATGASAPLSSANQYTWASVANDVTTNARIVLRLKSDSKTKAIPSAFTRIRAEVVVDQPTAAALEIGANTDYLVKWTPTGTFPGGTTVALEWTTDDFATIINAVTGPLGESAATLAVGADGLPQQFNWRVPSSLTSTGKVRVRVNGDTISAKSLNTFTIKGSLTGIVPNTTQYWMVGETNHPIDWASVPADQGDVKIVWSFDGTNFPEVSPNQLLATVNSTLKPYSFTVTAAMKGENVWWRVYRVLDANVKVTSAAPVKIYNLLLDQPTNGEILRIGTPKTIQWTKDAGAFTTPSNEFAVYKSIDGAGFVEITNPASRPTGTSFSYTPLDADRSNNVKFRVEWQGSTNVKVDSPQVSVRPMLNLTSPDSGTYSVDQQIPVTFSHTGRTGPSGDTWEIYYSTNGGDAGGGTYPPANKIHTTAIGPASPYTFNWTVPDSAGIVGNNVRFKVVMVGDETNVKDESVGTITLRGKLTVNYPTSTSTVWRVGESRTITWTAKQLTNVRIDYTKNNGTDLYGNVITASTGAAGGSYIWNPTGPPAGIPTTATSDQFIIRVKAIDAADSATEAFSAMFSVVPKLTLTYPTGGETMLVYALSPVATRKITWTRSGDSRNVNDDSVEIYYTKDTTADTDSDGIPDPPEGTWVAIATGASAPLSSAGEYTWASVANDVSTTARIVLRLKSDSKTKDIKTSFSRIRADVKLDTPGETGTQSYGVGTDKIVQWTPTGTFPGGTNVALEWSRDNFVADINTCMGPPPTPPSGGSLPVGADGLPQSFTWRIPNNTSTTVKVRVRVIGDTIENKSANNFALTGSLFVEVPNGPATAWVPGDAESIQWHQLGGIATIDIYYSKNNGTDGYPYVVKLTQAAGPESGSSVAWPGGVPNEVTANTYKIKIIDADNPGVTDVSDAGFIIKSRISAVTPGGSSPEYVGDSLTVAWTETGQPGPVTIELSKNGFADETQNVPITSGYTHGAQVQYVVPGGVLDALSETVKYRVKSEQADAALVASGVSASTHPIRGKITISALPTLILGDTANVTWSRSGTIGNVKVEYFDGTSWSTLTTTAAQNGPYPFSMTTPTINETATNGAMVRVSDADRPEVISTSAAFLVKPLLALTSPTNLDARVYNVGQNIVWTKRGSNVLNVKLEYFNGSVWADLFSGTTANDSSESWVAPDNVSNLFNKQIRISSLPAVDPWVVTNPQNGNFKITGTVAITSPIATDKWVAGSTNNIKWSKTGTGLTAIRLDYTTDNWQSSGNIVASYDATLGSTGYPWPIPLTAVTDNAIIKISDANDASVEAFSPAGFKIIPGFTVQRPINNERVKVKENFQIQWDRNGTGTPNTVNLYYSTNGGGGYTSIASAQINSGTYDWPVPDFTGLPNANAMVKVEWTGDAGANDESPLFKLVAGFTVTSPNSTADKWDVGEVNKPITWTCTSANVAKAKIEYSTNGGSSFDYTIASEADNTGLANAGRTYLWPAVDDTITSQFIVRVSQPFVSGVQAADIDFANGAGDISNANAKIKMYTRVLTPNASGIELVKYDAVNNPVTYNITWTTTGTGATTTNVKLLYSKDNFATPGIAIMDGALDYTLNDNTFLWQVPDDITTTAAVKVRVQSWTDLDAKDDSDNAFKIKGDYLISAPVNGSAFKIYHATQNPNPHSITWTTVGGAGATMGTVNLIAYSTDPIDPYFRDGSNNVYTLASPLTIVSGYTNNPNANTTYSWQVPDKASPTVKVRVINPADTTVVKDSAGTFRIEGAVTITYPTASGLTLTVGSPETITWNKTGSSVTRVKVSYSINGLAGPWTPILETEEGTNDDGIVTNNGDIPWTVPDLLALAPAGMPRENVMIKVEDPTNSNVSDPSDNAFKVKGNLVFVTPAAATPQTRWVTNESRIVSWTTTGSIAATDLVYTKNNFSNTTPVVSNYTNSIGLNTYSWTIPNDQSATVKLRLSDKNDGSNVSIDSAQFTIDLYNITFELRDLLSNNHITGASVNGSSTTGGYTWVSSVSSPITKGLQAGTWSVTFTKSEYADMGTTVVVDSDKTVVLYGETKVVHVWESISDLAYNTSTDTLKIASTLRRDGIVVIGATSCTVKIYDGVTLLHTFTQATAPDVNGFYSFTKAPPTSFVAGTVYNVVTSIVNATGGTINTPKTFHITDVKKLQDVQDTVNDRLDIKMSAARDAISDAVQDQLGFTATDIAAGNTMKKALSDQTGAIDTKLTSFETKTNTQIAALQAGATDIKTAAGNVELKGEDLEATNLKFAGRLMMPRTVLLNDKDIKLLYQAVPGIVPLITITTLTTTGKEDTVVKAVPMARTTDRDDTYEYIIDKITSPPYTPGKFATVLVEAETFTHKLQPSKGKIKNVEVGSFIVESTTLSTLEGLVAGGAGVKPLVIDALTVLRGMQSSGNTGNMVGLLETLNRKIDALPAQIAQQMSQQGDMVQMRNTLNEVATQIRSLAGDETGVDFSQLIGKALDESSSISDIRKKADAVQGTTEVMQVLMEQKLGGVDAPVVHVVYQ